MFRTSAIFLTFSSVLCLMKCILGWKHWDEFVSGIVNIFLLLPISASSFIAWLGNRYYRLVVLIVISISNHQSSQSRICYRWLIDDVTLCDWFVYKNFLHWIGREQCFFIIAKERHFPKGENSGVSCQCRMSVWMSSFNQNMLP